ncbi:D-alanine--D-alanine ligase [bacterium]|nr:MAG: D-alanine--D-alanine ligase [bacterium]
MKKKKLKVALIFGGTSPEREVSLRTGKTIAKYLNTKKYDVVPVEISSQGKWLVRSKTIAQIGREIKTSKVSTCELVPVEKDEKAGIDVAMLALHGPGGEDGTIQGMLELLKIPYTCSGVLASSLAMDKVRTKRLLKSVGVPVLPDIVVSRADFKKFPKKFLGKIHGRIVVKPNRMGSSLGVSIVSGKAAIKSAIERAFRYDSEILIEPFAGGREIAVPVLGNRDARPLPSIEIVPWKKSTFYDFKAKYEKGGSEHIIPAPLDAGQDREVKNLALLAHQALGCRGLTRSDFILDEHGRFIFLEINTIPGMTPTSLAPQSAQVAGISFPKLLDELIKLALDV